MTDETKTAGAGSTPPAAGYRIEGSIYEGYAACLVRGETTVAHFVDFRDALRCMDAFADDPVALRPAPSADEIGWVVGAGDGKRFRTWADGFSAWTEEMDEATRYARREDAEAVHYHDEDAWLVKSYSALLEERRADG